MSGHAACGSCRAPIAWGVTTQGQRMPIDVAPSQAGTVWITPSGAFRVLDAAEKERADAKGVELYVSHFATCASHERHRGVSRAQTALDIGGALGGVA